MYTIPTDLPPPPPPPLLAAWPPFGGGMLPNSSNATFGSPDDGDLSSNWSSLIGIVTAIVGNVLIALALNVQRYAHLRLHREHKARMRHKEQRARGTNGNARGNGKRRDDGYGGYGAVEGVGGSEGSGSRASRDSPADARTDAGAALARESDPLTSPSDDETDGDSDPDLPQSTSYLRSPYWWLGQVLITVGEMGNFLAYGFAPASIVSPLGVVALISNCVIAPMLFRETFRKRDSLGVVVAIAGAVTVVASAKQQETKLNPHDVWDAITTTAFLIYVGVTCSLIALLMWASPRYGHRTILIDLGLVGLFGGYTVLATKGVSSMLSSTLLGAFLTPMTYVLLVILLGTAVMQVRYVNKALQRFDSTQVIPIQFVMFTLCVIVGSAVLYRDFERTTAEQAATFVGGCLLTFFGVFVITSGRPPANTDDDDDANAEEDVAVAAEPSESINLAQQTNDDTPPTLRGSRRSSRASRVNFVGALTSRPLSLATDTGIPSQRQRTQGPGTPLATPSLAATSAPRVDYLTYKDDDDSGDEPSQPLLENPWRSASFSTPVAGEAAGDGGRPGLGPSPASADSVLHTLTATSTPSSPAPPLADRPVTPSALLRPQSQYLQGLHQSPMISPSPLLSSTMSAVVADTILQHLDGGSPQKTPRRLSTRRVRPSLRSSLFVPQDELWDEERGRAGEERLLPAFGAVGGGPYRHQRGESTDALMTGLGMPAGAASSTASTTVPPGRGRSLSTTLGGLFWTRRKSAAPGENNDPTVPSNDYTANDDIPPPSAAVTETDAEDRVGFFEA